MDVVFSFSLMEGFAMHIQQATYTFDSPEKANEAITGIWERGGYVRPTPGMPNSVDVVADTDAFVAIRSFAMPTAGAPAAPITENEQAEPGTAGNENAAPAEIEGAQTLK